MHLRHAAVARPFMYPTDYRGNIPSWSVTLKDEHRLGVTEKKLRSRISDTLGMDIKEMRELRKLVLTNA